MCGIRDVAAERGWKLGTLDHLGRVQSYLWRRRLLFHATLWQPTVSRQSKPEQNWTGPYLVHLNIQLTLTLFISMHKSRLITQHQLGHTINVRSHSLLFNDFVCQLFCGQNPVISIGIHAIWNFLWWSCEFVVGQQKPAGFESEFCVNCFLHHYIIESRQLTFFLPTNLCKCVLIVRVHLQISVHQPKCCSFRYTTSQSLK